MELLNDAISVLSPMEMHTLRKQLGVTFRALSKRTGVSTPQLCEFEHEINGLRLDQVRAVRDALVEIARERSQVLSRLLGPEIEHEEMATA
jgi:predicted transcriptional regulator